MKKSLKICGNTRYEDIFNAYKLGVRIFGFITNFSKSPRSLDFEGLNNLITRIKKELKHVFLVSVLVNPSLDDLEKIDLEKIDAIQLHGQESDEEIRQIRRFLPKHIEIWKAFTLKKDFDKKKLENRIKNISKFVELFLFDVQKTAKFESPKHVFCDLEFVDRIIKLNLKTGIAGGIDPKNIKNYSKYFNKLLIDISSGVEKKPGVKNMEIVNEVVKIVRLK